MNIDTSKIKVVKNEGDFKRAMDAGFAVNLHECADNEMWIILPMKEVDMTHYANAYGFTPVAVTH